ncbi:MAG: ATP-binding protein [Candidatus Anammoxibacter sp.]
MKEKYKLLYLILIMIFSVSLVGLFTYYQLYTTAIGKEREWLQNTAKSQARLLEAVARFDVKHSVEDHPEGAAAATLSQIADAHKHYKGFGKTGEFSLARREGDKIVFLLSHRHYDLDNPEPIPFNSDLAEPMKRAIAGKSGTMIGLDYRGIKVLAAYEHVTVLNIGIVAKMDITEIKKPFIVAASKSTLLALILITVGSYFFMRLINPIIKNLQNSKDSLAKAQEIARIGNWSWDKTTDKFKLSDEVYRILKISPTEFRETFKAFLQFVHPDDIALVRKEISNALKKGKPFCIDYRVKLPDKTVHVVHGEAEVYFNEEGKAIKMIGTIQDITQQRRALERITNLANILENSLNEIYIFDCKTLKFIQANKGARLNTGYSIEELYKLTPVDIKPEFTTESFRKKINPLLTGDKDIILFTTVHQRKDGSLYDVELHLQLSMFDSSPVFVAIILDISKRKRIEQELAKERKNLEKTVDVRTNELRKSLKKIEETNIELILAKQAQSKFLSSMSHELRTPLNAIMGYADLLNTKAYGSLNEEQFDFVKEINDSGKHLLALINDLLDVAKIDANAMTLHQEEISPDDFIGAAVRMLSMQFRKKNINIETSIDPTIKTVTADLRRCKQIMINLLSNAAKYTNEDGRVEIRAKKENELYLKVEVADTGIGIAKDDIEKIFSEFHQADRVRDEQLGGTGIGLALTQRLVKIHGGNIGVNSELGKGSTFWFTLPLRQPKSQDTKGSHKELTPDYINLANRRILIVEDNEVNLKMMLKILSTLGPEIAVADNGKQAIEIAKSFNPELILMDIRLPVMDGMEATKKLRAIPEFSTTPIIALTASVGEEAESNYIAAGCTEHLAKPIESGKLFKVLKKYLING